MGRPPGAKNKLTLVREALARAGIEDARNSGLLPLDVMLARMHGEPLPNGRMVTDEQFQAAVAAAPYVHPRPAATDATIRSDNIHYVVSDKPLTIEEWQAKYAHVNDAVAVELPLPVDERDETGS